MPIDFSAYDGLTEGKAASNQEKYGPNTLYEQERKGVLHYAKRLVQEPMLLMLLIAAVLYFIIGATWDGLLMIGGVLLMIGIDVYQERKTDKALEALKELSTPQVSVIRGGENKTVPSTELTVGDVMIVQEGDRIAGDGKLLDVSNFSVDESLLTGEPGAIFKYPAKNGSKEKKHKVFTGTLVLSGQAVVKVTAIGAKTQYGSIGASLAKISDESTPLQRQTGKIVKIFGAVGALACLSLMAIIYFRSQDLVDSLLKGLTLAISVIPEEIPVVLTVFAALGAYRLTRKQTLVRKINAIETLGHITTLCTDKTGTLTLNRMTLEEVYASGKQIQVKNAGKQKAELKEALKYSILASQPNPYDPMDKSIHELGEEAGTQPEEVYEDRNLIHEYGFNQKLKFMGHLWRSGKDKTLVIKGSAENVIERCNLDEEREQELLRQVDDLAGRGLRVLAVAKKEGFKSEPKTLKNAKELDFVSLLGFRDPPRDDAKRAVKLAQSAGISVTMITGDHPQTAMHIAKAVGICCKGGVMTGKELDSISEADLAEKLSDLQVFARIDPEQKLKIIAALKRRGEVVAMMGDGVNDAPSLKNADIGVAMGKRGTNVAREASDIILLDDRLITVMGAVEDGRRIFDNIQKAIAYIFIVHSYIVLTALIVPLAGLPILLTPIHIVLLELVIDPTCALVFETVPAEPGLMRKKPREPNAPIIRTPRLVRIFINGIVIFFVTGGAYYYALTANFDVETARTIGFSVIIWTNLFLVLTISEKHVNWKQLKKFIKTRSFIGVYGVVILALLALIYMPVVNARFGFTSLAPHIFAITAGLGLIPTLLGLGLRRLLHTKDDD
ncbi:HAD-IC family P-type ATPase [Candidatus Uhrbacteria bacterium]|nr:HAD-IC family P-type ATPase [Candidatus Uhrbacteria bacterium]